MTEMTMTVGRRRHSIVVAAPGCQGLPLMLLCCRRHGPTGSGSPRSEGGSTAGHRRGHQDIAAVVTAALAQWARITTGREDVDAACRTMTAPWVIERAERAQR